MSDSNNGQINSEGTEVAVPTTEQPAEVVEEPTLPDGVKERTAEEFEKLKASNKALSEELKTLKGSIPSPTSVLDELRPSVGIAPMAPIPMQVNQPLVDEGGYVDATLLNSQLTENRQKAEEARRIALQTQEQIQRFQESQVVQAVHKDFPEIDPNSDQFDPSFYDYVKNDLVGQMMKGKEDFRAAAEKARQVLGNKNAETPKPRKETLSSREQASATTSTTKSEPQSQGDHASLVVGTMKGDKDAIYKRLQASGY